MLIAILLSNEYFKKIFQNSIHQKILQTINEGKDKSQGVFSFFKSLDKINIELLQNVFNQYNKFFKFVYKKESQKIVIDKPEKIESGNIKDVLSTLTLECLSLDSIIIKEEDIKLQSLSISELLNKTIEKIASHFLINAKSIETEFSLLSTIQKSSFLTMKELSDTLIFFDFNKYKTNLSNQWNQYVLECQKIKVPDEIILKYAKELFDITQKPSITLGERYCSFIEKISQESIVFIDQNLDSLKRFLETDEVIHLEKKSINLQEQFDGFLKTLKEKLQGSNNSETSLKQIKLIEVCSEEKPHNYLKLFSANLKKLEEKQKNLIQFNQILKDKIKHQNEIQNCFNSECEKINTFRRSLITSSLIHYREERDLQKKYSEFEEIFQKIKLLDTNSIFLLNENESLKNKYDSKIKEAEKDLKDFKNRVDFNIEEIRRRKPGVPPPEKITLKIEQRIEITEEKKDTEKNIKAPNVFENNSTIDLFFLGMSLISNVPIIGVGLFSFYIKKITDVIIQEQKDMYDLHQKFPNLKTIKHLSENSYKKTCVLHEEEEINNHHVLGFQEFKQPTFFSTYSIFEIFLENKRKEDNELKLFDKDPIGYRREVSTRKEMLSWFSSIKEFLSSDLYTVKFSGNDIKIKYKKNEFCYIECKKDSFVCRLPGKTNRVHQVLPFISLEKAKEKLNDWIKNSSF